MSQLIKKGELGANSKATRLKWTTCLTTLFESRVQVESQIIAHTRILDKAYTAANQELHEVLRGKSGDIRVP